MTRWHFLGSSRTEDRSSHSHRRSWTCWAHVSGRWTTTSWLALRRRHFTPRHHVRSGSVPPLIGILSLWVAWVLTRWSSGAGWSSTTLWSVRSVANRTITRSRSLVVSRVSMSIRRSSLWRRTAGVALVHVRRWSHVGLGMIWLARGWSRHGRTY